MKWRAKSQAGTGGDDLKLYYAGDFHGVEQVWRKFLRAGQFYGAQALVMGGDLGGKAIVPIELHGDRFRAVFLGKQYAGSVDDDLDELKAAVEFNGFYPYVATETELARYRQDQSAQDELFECVMVEELRRWVGVADEYIDRSQVPVYVQPGNDDPWAFDQVLRESRQMTAPESGVVRVGEHEMISCCYSNTTPWHSPRELPEDDLYRLLKSLAEKVEDPSRAIFNFHVPPYDSGLDVAYKVNEDLSVATRKGQPVEAPVGSKAVRAIIEEYQPLLALHGHIHESRGAAKIGRTVCLNPGSVYNSGRIQGVLVTLGPAEVGRHQFVVG
jgi:Icc-related predicted phosphoesterase